VGLTPTVRRGLGCSRRPVLGTSWWSHGSIGWRGVLDRLGKADVGFKSLRETSVDTTSPQGRLVVNILARRELISARMSEGRKRAKASGA
jgi:Resolvase, N terminal domain